MTARATLRPGQRLRSQAVAKVLKEGRGTRAQRFVLLSLPNDLGYPRLALVVSKRLVARAVSRNRIRRLAREAFRLRQHELGGRDLVIRLTRPATPDPVTFREIDAIIESHCNG
ncbi:MAG: ribonuclease P protein component [Burkholderiales bacterium]|nr:ribonuclease P protein component [Burkholderiales bacterium]